ncbi:hypothetical protein V501_04733 [Pseudogymnoascus sp. VKM F-4519 (FW-2642)]|nr:hypothetical protein V501_04733 [Pseudogymnoascus sp. VKM F-4519 (FW-2642)]
MLSAEVRAEEEVGENWLGEIGRVGRIGRESEESFSGEDAGVRAEFEEFAKGKGKVCAVAIDGLALQILYPVIYLLPRTRDAQRLAEVRRVEHVAHVCLDTRADLGTVSIIAQDDGRLNESGTSGNGKAHAIQNGIADVANAANTLGAREY